MCNLQGALAVSCLFFNTVNCVIFPLIPKMVPNMDPKALNDPTKFVKEYSFGITDGLGQVSKDGKNSSPLSGNSKGPASSSGSSNDFLSGNFGIEIPFQRMQKWQNDMEIPSPFKLGLLPSATRQVTNSESPTPGFRSNFNDLEFQIGEVPSPPNLPNGPNGPSSDSEDPNHPPGKISLPSNHPYRQLPSQKSGLNEKSSLGDEFSQISPTSRFLNVETLPKGPIATLKMSGDIFLNSDLFSIKPPSS